jgi:hypothetical protein
MNPPDGLQLPVIRNVKSLGKVIFRKFAINEMKYLESENSQNRACSTDSLDIGYLNTNS